MTKAVLGIIGGSGIYDLPGWRTLREERVASSPGASRPTRCGSAASATTEMVFLPRHGAATGSRRPTSTTAPTSTR